MATGALPFVAVAGFEKRFTFDRIGGLTRLRGVTRQQLGRRSGHRMKRCKEQERE